MGDSRLKKEFKQKDVQRVRNLMQGKYGEKTETSVGYYKKETNYKEGDIWEEDGRKWTIKEGIRQNITKLDKAKKTYLTPLFCPNCKKQMKKRFDKDYYQVHKKCYDCVIDFEHELRKVGLWEEYEKNIINADIEGFINDFRNHIEEELTQANNSYITERGDVEKWVGGPNKDRVLKAVDKTIEHLNSLKK